MGRLAKGLIACSVLLPIVGCPGVEILGIDVPKPNSTTLVVHAKVQDLAHVAQRCRVVAEFGQWRGVGDTPMFLRVEEPQDVYSEIKYWERAYHRVAEGMVRVRFFYRNELLQQAFFPAPHFDEASLERQTHWPRRTDWPDPRDPNSREHPSSSPAQNQKGPGG